MKAQTQGRATQFSVILERIHTVAHLAGMPDPLHLMTHFNFDEHYDSKPHLPVPILTCQPVAPVFPRFGPLPMTATQQFLWRLW